MDAEIGSAVVANCDSKKGTDEEMESHKIQLFSGGCAYDC